MNSLGAGAACGPLTFILFPAARGEDRQLQARAVRSPGDRLANYQITVATLDAAAAAARSAQLRGSRPRHRDAVDGAGLAGRAAGAVKDVRLRVEQDGVLGGLGEAGVRQRETAKSVEEAAHREERAAEGEREKHLAHEIGSRQLAAAP